MEQHILQEPNKNSTAGIFYKSWLTSPIFFVSNKIQIRESFGNGWSAYAIADIEKTELLEYAFGINLDIRESAQKDNILHKYLWKSPIGDLPACHCFECKQNGSLFYLFGGYVNFYKNTNKPEDANATFVVIENANKKILWKDNYPSTPCHLGILYASKDIKANEQIVVYYGDRYNPEGDNNFKKIPHMETSHTMYPPNIRLWRDDLGDTLGQLNQTDGSRLVPPLPKAQLEAGYAQVKESQINDGSIPEDLDLEKLLQGSLNRVEPNK